MAYGNIKGITIEINGDTSKLTTALRNVDKQARDTTRNLRDIQAALKYDKSKGPELAEQKQRELARAIENTKEKLDVLKKGQAGMSEEFKKTAEGSAAYDNLTREIWKTEKQLKSFEAQSDRSYQKLAKVRDEATKFGKAAQDIGKGMTKKVTAPLVGIAGIAGNTAMDFDSGMSKVKAISGATGNEFDALRNKAREMGAKTQFSASEAADAMNYMAMAGWKSKDMISGIDGVMNLAAASGEDLATTSDIVTDALTAFGLEAKDSSHFADILAATSSNANTNVGMMGETFKYIAPIAGALGYSAEDTALAIGLMANSGIKASQAGTSLRMGLTRLAAPTKQVHKGMDMLGLSIEDVQGKSLDETLRIFRSSFANLDETQQAQAASMIFGKNAMSGMLAIINASEDDYNSLSDAIYNADGSAEKMADTMMDNLGGQLKILKSALEELAISFGDLLMPVLRDAVDGLTEFVNKLNSMSDDTKGKILVIAAIVAALGPLLLIIGKIATVIGTVAGALGVLKGTTVGATPAMIGLSKAIGGVQTVFGALKALLVAHPIAAIIIAALTIVVPLIIKNWDEIKEFLTNAWESIREIASNVWTSIAEFVGGIWEGVKEAWSAFWDPIGEWLGQKIQAMIDTIKPILDTFVNVFKVVWMLIEEIFKTTWEVISGFFRENWEAFVEMARIIFEPLKEFFTSLWNGIKDVVVSVWTSIKEFLQGVWQTIYDVAKPIFDAIKNYLSSVWESIKTTASNVWNSIKNTLSRIWNAIYDVAKPIFDAIKNFISEVWNGIKTTTSNIWNSIKTTLSNVWNSIKETASRVWNGIKSAIEGPMNTAKNMTSNIANGIKNGVTGAWSGITTTVSNVWEGVKNSITGPIETARDIVRNAIESIKSYFNVHLQFPHIKLPHFGISGGFSLDPPQVPHFTIDWYKKGAIFTKPTMFNTPFGMKGVGEAGAEAVLPIEKLDNIVASAILKAGGSDTGVTVTGNTFNVREESDIDKIARELYRLIESKKRGVGLG
jgi:phage tail tape measure protein, TP901 family|nr:MAG TPA: minor tail protein [Caudoviricetes sp.]